MWKTMIYPLVYCVLTCGLGFGTCENIPDILLQLSSPVMFVSAVGTGTRLICRPTKVEMTPGGN